MEDDFTLCDNFKQKIDCLNDIMKELPIIFFGYHMFEKNHEHVKDIYDVESKTIKIEKLVKELYIGGTHCYSINKIGAKHMLNYISQNGIKHGIDYVIGKLNPEFCYESQPHLAFAEWNENNKEIDTDIQNVYDGVELPDDNKMKTIVFHDNQLCERGTTMSIYNYAYYNKKLLGNESIILYEKNNKNNVKEVIELFSSKFKVCSYEKWSEVDNILLENNCDILYLQKSGEDDGKISKICKTVIHCVFNTSCFHGDIYSRISNSFGNPKYPIVPYIVDLPNVDRDMRELLNIPKDAVVFGRHGGFYQFDIEYVHKVVYDIAYNNKNIYFLFLNTKKFCEDLYNIIHLEKIINLNKKTEFINTCDAMLWARSDGETFGLAIGEFSIKNKPIIATKCGDLSHVDILKENALWYQDYDSLKNILINFNKNEMKNKDDWNCYKEFCSEVVMKQFNDVFINSIGQYNIEENNIQDNFIFIHNMDQLGNDLYYKRLSIQECMKIALSDVNCKGFNTLGFFKSKIEELKPSGYFRENIDGLYIKKNILENNNEKYNNHENISLKINELQHERYIRIKMLCNWCSSEQLCKEWSNMCDDVNNMSWKQLQMTSTNNDNEIDYYVIINKPYQNDTYYNPKKTIVFQMEPWVNDSTKNWGVKTWGEWAMPSISKFMAVRGRKTKYHNNAFWQLELSLNQIKHLNIENKLNKISSICSEKYFDEGHIARIDFLKYIEKRQLEDEDNKDNIIELDIYNQNNNFNMRNYRGLVTPYIDKSKGILPYKYYFMIENNYEENFITEKLWEPILCETLCFYYGCPNVTDYINKDAFVLLPIDDFEKSYQIIKQSIKEDLWSKRIEIIRQEKQKILNELGFFPVIKSIITKPKNVCFIHCFSMPGKEKRLGYLIEKLISSKLINVLDKIYINNIGLPLSIKHDKIDVNNYSRNNKLYELPTLNKIREFSIENNEEDINILYLHNKGVSYENDNKYVNDWIDMMIYFLVERHENCINILNDKNNHYDTIGCNYYDENGTTPKHFSGNFWWAKTGYLQKLPKFEYNDNDKDFITLDKLTAEYWLFKENPRYYNLHSSGINHFHETYPKNKYCL